MAKSLNKGYDSSSDATGVTASVAGIKFPTTHRVKSETPGQTVLANITSPLGREEKFTLGFQDVKDVYKNTTIYPGNRAADPSGFKVLSKVQETWLESDSADPTYSVLRPVGVTITITGPNCETITVSDIQGILGRALSGFYDGVAGEWTLAQLMRGVTTPPGL